MSRMLRFSFFLCLLCYVTPSFSIELRLFSINPEIASHSKFSTNIFKDVDVHKLALDQVRLDERTYHLFSHGRSGSLLLNGKWLNAQGIASFLKSETNAASFTHLNIYGCEFGKGEAGKAAVAYLSKKLAVTVSASDGLTGKDGNWDLEVGTYVSVKGLENFPGNLQCVGISGGTGTGDDFDGDGICNDLDIDDDNDGIPDAIESPGCFYTEGEATIISSVTTQLTTTALIALSYDRDASTQSAFTDNQNWVDKTIFEITPTSTIAISAVNFDVGSWGLSKNGTSTFKLQGWGGSAWVDLSDPIANTGTADFSVSNSAHPTTKYAKYRLVGVAGTCYAAGINEITVTATQYLASFNPKPTCSNDPDSDTRPNHMDLDSDGDGCSDLVEAGVSPTTDMITPANSQLNPAGTDTNNDGLNDSVDSNQNGIPDYVSTYSQYALDAAKKACADTDGDTKLDLVDYDDDNDGILDTEESPDCYYTEAQAKTIVSVTTELTIATGAEIGHAYDGSTSTAPSTFTTSQNWIGKTIFEITPTTPLAVSTVNFDIGTWGLSTNGSSTFKLQGWSGFEWVDLSDPMANATAVDFAISNDKHAGIKYTKYRIVGVAGTCYAGAVNEITLTAYQFVQTLHPKPTCTSDFDKDGIVNQLDLDSDGDGCTDAVESAGTFTTDDLVQSDIPGGNTSGGGYTGVSYGVVYNLGKTVDANGVPSSAAGGKTKGQSQTVAGTPCPEICGMEISGKVYKDSDGIGNGINGTVVNGTATGIYMSLVSGSTVKSVKAVSAGGAYSFTGIRPGTYKLVLGVSSSGSTTASFPGGGMAVAEGGAIDGTSGNSMGDGTADGATQITITCPQTNAYKHVDFGVLGGAFPVTLISFGAQQITEGIKLTWRTADEKNFDRFEIEYSELPQTGFTQIGVQKGGGSQYVYTDAGIHTRASYYRLKMVDTDGSYDYSRIVTISHRNGVELNHVYPNPSNGRSVNIASNGPIDSYKIYDVSGREVAAEMSGRGGQYAFKFAKNMIGTYVIVYKAGGQTISQQFVLND